MLLIPELAEISQLLFLDFSAFNLRAYNAFYKFEHNIAIKRY